MTPQRVAALASLRKLIEVKAKSDDARRALKAVDDAAYGDFHAIPSAVEGTLVRLIDAVFAADGIAEYLLYEVLNMKDGGYVEFPGGQKYPIRTVDDVEILLREQYPE